MQNLGNTFILSDSYSTFEGHIPEGYDTWYPAGGKPATDVTDVSQTWWHRLISHTESNLLLNCSYSGTPICNTGYGGSDCTHISFIGRLDQLIDGGYFRENTVDTFIILGGTNDAWAESPVGELKFDGWTKDDLFSVLPAYCYLLNRVKTCIPGARVINIMNDGLPWKITDGFRTACEKYGADMIGLQDIDKLNGHPSIRGMEQIEAQVLAHFSK